MSWFDLRILKTPGAEKPLVISIPKSAVPLATRRNRIKRLMREAVRRIGKNDEVYFVRVFKAPTKVRLADVLQEIRKRIEKLP